jgi:cobalamin-dependent methionine synthase I
MCVDCVLASPRIAQVDPGDEPLPEVVLSQLAPAKMGFFSDNCNVGDRCNLVGSRSLINDVG